MSQSQTINEDDIQEIQAQQSDRHDPFHQQKKPSKRYVRHRNYLVSLIIFLIRQLFRSNNLPFLLTFIWHSFSLRSHLFYSRKYLKRYIIGNGKKDLSHTITVDVIKRLGGINSSLALLALLALTRFSKDMTAQKVVLLVFATANGTQAWLDFKSWKIGRWNWTFLTESGGGNSMIALINMIAYCVSVAKTKSIL